MTHNRARFVVQHLLNLFHNLSSQLGQNVDSPQVLNQLLRFGGPEDDSARIRVNLGHPRERELGHAAFQVCSKPRVNGQSCARTAFSCFHPTFLRNFSQLLYLGDLLPTFLRTEVLHCPGTPNILVHRITRVFRNSVVVLMTDKNKDPQAKWSGEPKE